MEKNKKVWLGLAAVTALWLTGSIIMSVTGLFDQAGEPPTYFGLFVGGPIAGFLALYKVSKTFREALLAIPLWWIVAVHWLRFVGIFFVLDVLSGTLPPFFGWPAGLGDIIAAAVALPLAIALQRGYRPHGLRRRFVAWNIFGLADLFAAIVLGILYSESAFGLLSRPGLDSQSFTHLPFSLVPTFYVPMLILLHFLALRRRNEVVQK